MRIRSGPLVALAAAAVLAGCTSSIAGTPRPGLTPVDISTLKTGPYTPEPTAYTPAINDPADVRMIEARRMLGYLAHPSDIDGDISVLGAVHLFATPRAPFDQHVLPEKYRPVTVENNLLAGVYVSRINESLRSRKKLIVSVLRFPTEAAARKAADDFDRITDDEPGRHPVPVEGHPEARATSADDITAVSFTARGPFAVIINVGVPQPDRAALGTLFQKTLERQSALLEHLTPTPLDDVLDFPIDPDSIMRRALPRAPDFSDPFFDDVDFGAVDPTAQLHFERNPVQIEKVFQDSGVDLIGRRGGIIYRTRDQPAAFSLQTALLAAGKNDEELPTPPGLPDVRCLRLDEVDPVRDYDELCAVVYRRYVAVVVSKTPPTGRVSPLLYQRAAAQYAILAKSE